MKKILSVLIICLLSACASKTTQPTSELEDRTMGGGGMGAGAQEGMRAGGGGFGMDPLRDPSNILSQRSIYFDFDNYTIKNEYRDLVLAHARYLRDNSNSKVLIQGNTDERGSREYNLALGQRRADSVKNAMLLSGARDHQIESVSLGEEKPRAAGRDESAWTENRRADILYQGEY
ncbi:MULTISPECIES: peptidoglycan-associated lipoprotein Pal [Nitrosomonas]|uniref:Peptidoglycan-associated lipoprotein n=1 Tax=Nitrosomonas communis TaxID=44574 RepID=A0A0F7KDA5_9PROT|nr:MULTISPECIES: peptidoglycan-associated lipoprotein Pal [Nitrosomonas]AKH36769.1 peptidoglycan-binding protein [Nitrosomonas communis]TYP86682.1 peptidoglycan-associated lipoprotein [Nitrosomonas communis]UVS61838.1 peptidoglycan-associated lipoprotein Pal [Nitrosomonas sp. PLL12]